jgi:tripartite-type tricarboxylate transporter receptor subunit TctC
MKTLIRTALLLTIAASPSSLAQDRWPERQITVIVPFALGGGTQISHDT